MNSDFNKLHDITVGKVVYVPAVFSGGHPSGLAAPGESIFWNSYVPAFFMILQAW